MPKHRIVQLTKSALRTLIIQEVKKLQKRKRIMETAYQNPNMEEISEEITQKVSDLLDNAGISNMEDENAYMSGDNVDYQTAFKLHNVKFATLRAALRELGEPTEIESDGITFVQPAGSPGKLAPTSPYDIEVYAHANSRSTGHVNITVRGDDVDDE